MNILIEQFIRFANLQFKYFVFLVFMTFLCKEEICIIGLFIEITVMKMDSQLF